MRIAGPAKGGVGALSRSLAVLELGADSKNFSLDAWKHEVLFATELISVEWKRSKIASDVENSGSMMVWKNGIERKNIWSNPPLQGLEGYLTDTRTYQALSSRPRTLFLLQPI